MKKITLLILVFLNVSLFAQDKESVVITGQITGDVGEDVEGIAIYNTITQRGTVTDVKGNFTLEVSLNDILYIRGLQFQERMVTIDEEILEDKSIVFYLNTALNTLDEILIKPHNLTGNLKIDADGIEINTLDLELAMSFANLDLKKVEVPDSQSKFKQNYSLQALGGPQLQNGVNGMEIIRLLSNNLFKKSTSKGNKKNNSPTFTAEKIKNNIPESYFIEILKLPENRIPEFLEYVETEDFPDNLLGENNLLKLMTHLQLKSEDFLALTEK